MSSNISNREENDASQAANCDDIPVIDLSSLNSTDVHERRKLADLVYDACTEVGFFYIKNHGIPEDMINSVHRVAERFFSLPEEQKMKYYIGNSQKFRGYSPLGAEKATGTEEEAASEENMAGALSEAFDIGYEIFMDFKKSKGDILPTDTYGLYGDNQWPDQETIPDFAKTYLEYCGTVLEVCRRMMRIFALSLDLPEDFFDSKMQHPGVTSRMMHYPAQPVRGEVQEGLGAHTDYECFTILSQGRVPGLQVLNHRGEWVLAPPITGTLVVNIADCLSIWSNKRFKSTIHRVTNLAGEERYSVPFFFGVDYDTTISVLENHISDDNPACKAPFKAGEWVREKLSKAYMGYNG
ncbi:2OG-Fe(II) oxygenase family oxidoreductase [Biscogniauxia marginata]|nr:2OG-Fe(II) oxygenase family oxidoreductase [Biscogniauxia marginata]